MKMTSYNTPTRNGVAKVTWCLDDNEHDVRKCELYSITIYDGKLHRVSSLVPGKLGVFEGSVVLESWRKDAPTSENTMTAMVAHSLVCSRDKHFAGQAFLDQLFEDGVFSDDNLPTWLNEEDDDE